MRARGAIGALTVLLLLVLAAPASAVFPYTRAGGDPTDPADLYLGAGTVPTDLGGNEFKFAATPDPANAINNLLPVELGGVRGAHVVDDDAAAGTAFQTTTGRPDVTIAILDSGIKWNDAGAMTDLRKKVRLSQGEVPKPRNDALATPNEAGENCSGGGPYTNAGDWDLNGDGVFNVIDFACDNRVQRDSPKGVGPAGVLEPQDILIAFSDGVDDDANGYVDDMVGWDFLDDDNDPYDDVQYGHGTGEARDSTAEANNGGDVGSCPNCMGVYMRVGDSFVADVNRFGAAVTYAVDNDVQIIQEALGTLNNSTLSRQAVNYAYRHGVVVMASAADEAAQHNNWPSTLPHVIVANSVTPSEVPEPNKSYLAFNGCTNFSAKITIAIPSTSCSSNAVGLAAGYAGLIYSAALNAREAGVLGAYPDTSSCRLVGGDPCPITPNEIRQVMASGTFGGTGQVDDVNFAGTPAGSGNEPSCSPAPLPGCTSPYGFGGLLRTQVDANRPALAGPPLAGGSYPARKGHDQFYGYGRANMDRAVDAVQDDPVTPGTTALPPEAEIFSPEWFSEVDPAKASVAVDGEVFARGAPYRCEVLVAPGQYPNNALTTAPFPGDFEPLGGGGWCDGSTVHNAADAATLHRGTLGSIDVAHLKARFPAGTDFQGPIPQPTALTGNGRPFFAPHAFTFKVVVTPTTGPARTGEDQRSAYLHRDRDLLNGFPRSIEAGGKLGTGVPSADGDSSPAFADLDGDNRNELVLATGDGFVHAIRPDGSELPGWPVRGDRPGIVGTHVASHAYASGEVGSDLGGPFLAAVAVGDTDGDGVPEVYAADFEGRIYGWGPDGKRIFTEGSRVAYSGKPLAPFENVRKGNTNRTQHGFFASPVLADLDGDGDEEIIAAAMDRHIYAWDESDSDPSAPGGAAEQPGYPMLVVDPSKVQSVAPQTHAITFRGDAGSYQQGAIIDTPAVGDITGDGLPELVIGTNEEYDEPFNVGNGGGLVVLTASGFVDPRQLARLRPAARGRPRLRPASRRRHPARLAAPHGAAADRAPAGGRGGGLRLARDRPGQLPERRRGSEGRGGVGRRARLRAQRRWELVLRRGIRQRQRARQRLHRRDGGHRLADHPGRRQPRLRRRRGGLRRRAPVVRALGDRPLPRARPAPARVPGRPGPGRRLGSRHRPVPGQLPGDDERPAVPDRPGDRRRRRRGWGGGARRELERRPRRLRHRRPPGRRLAEALDRLDRRDAAGRDVRNERHRRGARKVVVGVTRSGYVHAYGTSAPACSPSSSPRFHHDNANSGDYSRDAVLPGVPGGIATNDERTRIRFTAPGDDLLCGTADHFELATADEADRLRGLRRRQAAEGEGGARSRGGGEDAALRRARGKRPLRRDPRRRRAGERRAHGLGPGEAERRRETDRRARRRSAGRSAGTASVARTAATGSAAAPGTTASGPAAATTARPGTPARTA